jgi:hypothetical protein
MNYNVFDPFLGRDTWHTKHANDLFVFYRCLQKVIDDPDFNPEHGRIYQSKEKSD